MKYNELVYMVLDRLKLSTDDTYYTHDHILFMLNTYRTFLLKQRYTDLKKIVPDSNYQTVCVPVALDKTYLGCNGVFLRTTKQVPYTMAIGNTRVYTKDIYIGDIAFVSIDRFKYVGLQSYLKDMIYCARNPNGFYYLKSFNPQMNYLKYIKITGIFEDTSLPYSSLCDPDLPNNCDYLEQEFPIESALVNPLIDLVVQSLSPSLALPEDTDNNAKDDIKNINNEQPRQ